MPALTIKAKLILAYSLVIGLFIAGFSFVVYRSTRDAGLAGLDALLDRYAGKLMIDVEDDYYDNQLPDSADLSEIAAEGLSGARLQVTLPSGEVVVSDSLLKQCAVNQWREAFDGEPLHETVLIGGRYYRVLWQPVEIDEEYPYVLEVAASMDDYRADLLHLRLLLLLLAPATLLVTGLSAYWITRAAFRPISTMTETARMITASNLEARLELPRAQDEVRRLGETLNDLMERLDSAFKSQRQFVADASHEIRTPLAIVRTELEYALKQVTDSAVKESIQASLAEVERLTKMTAQLLLLAKLDASSSPLDIRTVRLDELLVECVQVSNALAAKKGVLTDIYVGDAVELQGDGEKLRSVILNLLDNAIKYSPQGSKICASLRLDRANHVALLSVEDNGPGIPAAELPNIFKRFYRSDSVRGEGSGSGLGLAIAQRIVELHRGRILVRSTEGSGTSFTVELPLLSGA